MIISIICAMGTNRIIGNDGKLPWHLPSDMKRFKEITTGHPVIMGRKTFASILARAGKPLPNRMNVVITRDARSFLLRYPTPWLFQHQVLACSSLEESLATLRLQPEVFVIGGAEIYAQALPIANKMYFTQVGGCFEGDAEFPQFDMSSWDEVHSELITTDTYPYTFSVLKRRGQIS